MLHFLAPGLYQPITNRSRQHTYIDILGFLNGSYYAVAADSEFPFPSRQRADMGKTQLPYGSCNPAFGAFSPSTFRTVRLQILRSNYPALCVTSDAVSITKQRACLP